MIQEMKFFLHEGMPEEQDLRDAIEIAQQFGCIVRLECHVGARVIARCIDQSTKYEDIKDIFVDPERVHLTIHPVPVKTIREGHYKPKY